MKVGWQSDLLLIALAGVALILGTFICGGLAP